MLPETSEASLAHGLWFVFDDNSHKIRAWASALTGGERIYLDDTVVSEWAKVGLESRHLFAADGANYTVTFRAGPLRQGEVVCTLTKNGAIVGALRSRRTGGTGYSGWRLWAALATGAAIGTATALLSLSYWLPVAVIGTIFIAGLWLRMRHSHFAIEPV